MVGDTPEAVEYRGMQNLLSVVKEHVGYRHGKLIFSADGQVSCLERCVDAALQRTTGCRLLSVKQTHKSSISGGSSL